MTMAKRIPCVTAGTIYAYLSSRVGHESGEGTFRALTRGYTHWASGRIDHLDINTQHPEYCHIQSVMKPSVKPGGYHVWLLLGRDGPFASIQHATCICECAAGKCVGICFMLTSLCYYGYNYMFHLSGNWQAVLIIISALLHALVSLTASQFQLRPNWSP